MADFFEFQKRAYVDVGLSDIGDRNDFKEVLDTLWRQRRSFGMTSVFFEDEKETEQQFFTLYENHIKAGKYIGSIKHGDKEFHILPKIFETKQGEVIGQHVKRISNRTMLWWLSRCSKIEFPKSFSSWDTQDFDFLDILVHLFATLTRDDLVFNKQMSYVEREEEIGTLRGRIDFGKYASNYYTGKAHVLPCVYDSLEINNLYNQIIKFTSKMLLQHTKNEKLKELLFEIIWMLDEVDDVFVTSFDCARVVVSPLNENMQVILNYCKMFLSGMSIKTDDNNLDIFAFLIPTERLFEDFIFGFVNDEFSNENDILSIESQGDKYGKQVAMATSFKSNTKPINAFRLKPDIYIHKRSNDIILDSKYKVIYSKEESNQYDRKQSGVSISDVYQMLAYTVKLDVKTCHLLYPELPNSKEQMRGYYEIDHHNNQIDESVVHYHRLPTVILNSDDDLSDLVRHQEKLLKSKLQEIIYV